MPGGDINPLEGAETGRPSDIKPIVALVNQGAAESSFLLTIIDHCSTFTVQQRAMAHTRRNSETYFYFKPGSLILNLCSCFSVFPLQKTSDGIISIN